MHPTRHNAKRDACPDGPAQRAALFHQAATMKVKIELDAEDAKFIIDSARRFVDAAEKYAKETGRTANIEAWLRIRDAAIEAKPA